MGIIISDDLKFKNINDHLLGKFMKLTDFLCNDGIIRKSRTSWKNKYVSKLDLKKYLGIANDKTFSNIFQEMESHNLLHRRQIAGKGFIIFINPFYCRLDSYKTNIECEEIFSKDRLNLPNIYYVYRFLNKDNDIIYVGRTNNLESRIKQHLSSGHLPDDCYKSIEKIEYIELGCFTDMSIYEIYYINKYLPIYNTKDKDELKKETTITLPEQKWKEYLKGDDNIVKSN